MSTVAAIDCGTNSVRLLITTLVEETGADGSEASLVDLERRMEIVRLGQGVDRTGSFAPEALERTFTALRGYAELMHEHGVPFDAEHVRMAATSATRDAANRQEFIDGVREILGVEPEVVTGEEEAELSFIGATAELEADPEAGRRPFLVVDIGGGSTEFVLGYTGADAAEAADSAVRAAVSVDIGCVRMTERHLADDPPSAEQIAAAERDIDAALDAAEAQVPLREAGTVVCVAGTATTVAGMSLGLPAYDSEAIHLTRVGADRADRIARDLLAMPHAERAEIGVMHPGRVDVIGAGALVLDRVLARTGADAFIAGEHDILDGLAWSLILGAE
ncbi:Ppx/GppA phosphatase family protein [Nocardiopsis coralliicola]